LRSLVAAAEGAGGGVADIAERVGGSARHADAPGRRSVDVLVTPDGELLVSDDRADAVYRISYARPAR
jgi:glucose/arabinose dehydrogenase